jgi:peptidyl-prolyl cis-trans isomerase D
MGMITSIRKRLWMVTILMALALVGFIVMDMTTGNSASLFNNPDTVGTVAGQSLSWNEFQQTERVLYANSEVDFFGRKDYLWNQFLEKSILEKDAACNGTGVSPAEIKELEFGFNLSPIIERNFRDPNTGQTNREQLNTFKQGIEDENLDPRLKDFWLVQEKEVIKERLYSKLGAIVTKSLYMPNFMIERNQYESNLKLDFAYAVIPYGIVKDEEIKIEEEDYKKLIKEREAVLKTEEETRSIKYCILDIIPTSEDSNQIHSAVASKIEALKNSTDDSSFVVANLGKWDDAYQRSFEVSPVLVDTIFKMKKGEVYGPYIDAGEYKIAKLMDKKLIPDSVKSRHILIRVQTREQYLSASKLLDSLMNLVKTGKASFDSLAIKTSQDQGSAVKGGDLGFMKPGTMLKPLNNAIFFQLGIGEMKIVLTQFGLHLIQVTDAKYDNKYEGVHVAIIGETILPGESISNTIYDEAQNLVQSHRKLDALEKAIEEGGKYKMELAGHMFANSYEIQKFGLNTNNTTREIVRWAFAKDTKVGDVGTEIYSLQENEKKYTNRYVIAALQEIVPKGLASIEPFKDQLKGEIVKSKKFEKIKEILGQFSELAPGLGGYTYKIDTAYNIAALSTPYIQNLGEETKVIANLSKLAEGQSSQALQGENGVFICKILKKEVATNVPDFDAIRRVYVHPAKNVAMSYLMTAMKKQFKIKDNRSKFF